MMFLGEFAWDGSLKKCDCVEEYRKSCVYEHRAVLALIAKRNGQRRREKK